MTPDNRIHLLPIAALALLAGCVDSGPTGEDFVVRDLPESQREFRVVETSHERFRYRTNEASASSDTAPGNGGPRLVYETPEGWTEQAASMMRDINFKFGENGEGECYVARLPGAGGGLLANVNRWRGQMGAEPLTQEQVDQLPSRTLFGQPAAYVTVDGDFSAGMGSAEKKPGYRLVGLVLASDAGAVFVKMTGPRALVESNEGAFETFTSSLDVSTGGDGS